MPHPLHPGTYSPSSSGSRRHDHEDGQHGIGYRGPYPYFGYGFALAYGFAEDNQDSGNTPPPVAPSTSAPEDAGAELAANGPPLFRPLYQPLVSEAPVHPQPATTLIFKDGRPSKQVHNYALTANTLYALDGETRQEIPLSVLDVQATIEANRAAGVDFALPVSR